jgi:small GTP-binding protein
VECYEKDKYIDNKKLLIKIWDTAGQEKFAVMAKSYYQRAHGIIVACALDNKGSFYNLRNWLNSIKDNTAEESIQLIIIANKCDLTADREVQKSEIEAKAKEIKAEYFETSAKENINIDEAFNTIIEKVYKNVYSRPKGFDLNNGGNNSTESKKCCLR